MSDFKDKRVLVTGASRGIGAAIAAAFAQAGARVHVLAETDEIDAAAAAIGATPHLADVTDERAVARALDAAGPSTCSSTTRAWSGSRRSRRWTTPASPPSAAWST